MLRREQWILSLIEDVLQAKEWRKIACCGCQIDGEQEVDIAHPGMVSHAPSTSAMLQHPDA